jgi:hypothetical protein
MVMTLATIVNSMGLVLDIAGALLLWKYGLPGSISREGHVYLALEQDDEEEKAKARKYDQWSYGGLTLLILGFGLQLISNFL